jgi:chemotaxis protein CheX
MIDKIPLEDIIANVRAAVHDVFSTMLGLPLDDLPAFQETEADPSDGINGVEALVGIAGSWNGTGRICCTSQFALRMAGALLMSAYDALNEEVLDAVAEVANMVIGNVKTNFEERLGPLGLSVPTVIFGRNYRTRSAGVPSWTVVPFGSAGEKWEVRFCLMPARAQAHAPHPPHPHIDLVPSS